MSRRDRRDEQLQERGYLHLGRMLNDLDRAARRYVEAQATGDAQMIARRAETYARARPPAWADLDSLIPWAVRVEERVPAALRAPGALQLLRMRIVAARRSILLAAAGVSEVHPDDEFEAIERLHERVRDMRTFEEQLAAIDEGIIDEVRAGRVAVVDPSASADELAARARRYDLAWEPITARLEAIDNAIHRGGTGGTRPEASAAPRKSVKEQETLIAEFLGSPAHVEERLDASQSEIASAVGLSRQAVGRRMSKPQTPTLARVMRALNVQRGERLRRAAGRLRSDQD